jgi:hypothetical protein
MDIRTTKQALGLASKRKRMIHAAASSQVSLDSADALEGIQQGLADAKAGRTKPARQVFARLRRKHVIPD